MTNLITFAGIYFINIFAKTPNSTSKIQICVRARAVNFSDSESTPIFGRVVKESFVQPFV